MPEHEDQVEETIDGRDNPATSAGKTDDLSVSDDTLAEFSDELNRLEKKIAGEFEPGLPVLVIAIASLGVFCSLLLPHVAHCRGVDILSAKIPANASIKLPSILFVWFALIFDCGFSVLALLTRRWFLAVIAAAGSVLSVVFGILSIWTRQTPGLGSEHPPAPSIGLIMGVILVFIIATQWLRVVWKRTQYHLAVEAERKAVAELEKKQHNDYVGILSQAKVTRKQ